MVMNNKKQVFGVVENVEENKDYTGKTTNTAKVTVNNVEREISVDVDFSGMLGETRDTAYPGHLGSQNRNLIANAFDQISEETRRAVDSEESLKHYIDEVAWDIDVSDNRLNHLISEEADRAKNVESSLGSSIQKLSEDTDDTFKFFEKQLEDTHSELLNQDTEIYNKLELTEAEFSEDLELLKSELSSNITDVSENLEETTTDLNKQITRLSKNFTSLVSDVNTNLNNKIESTSEDLVKKLNITADSLSTELHTVENNLSENISSVENTLSSSIDSVSKDVDSLGDELDHVKENYAEKTYVYEKLVEFTKLSKQIADSIDLEQDTVTINGVVLTPLDGVVYLVKDTVNPLEDSYKQYTLIDKDLVLIGTTSIDLSEYAKVTFVQAEIDKTKQFVNEQIDAIPEVDLTDYAKKQDIPDVSSFIAEIPSEYITEEEIAPYATKVYVKAEMSKVGNLFKQVVDEIDFDLNTVTIGGITESATPDVVYLIFTGADDESYSQYTLIDEKLTWIGNTNIDLKGYATQEYVDSSITEVETSILCLLNNIKFIDGGTSTSILS